MVKSSNSTDRLIRSRAQGVRPALPGLKGAKIVGYENPKPDNFIVRYEVFGDPRSIEYEVADNGSATFNFVSGAGNNIETYSPRGVVAVTVVKILNSRITTARRQGTTRQSGTR